MLHANTQRSTSTSLSHIDGDTKGPFSRMSVVDNLIMVQGFSFEIEVINADAFRLTVEGHLIFQVQQP